MLDAMMNTIGNISKSCDLIKITRQTHYNWLEKDANYRAHFAEIPERILDFYENALHKGVNDGDKACIIFALKCKGKHRGWVEKSEIQVSGSVENTINADTLMDVWKEINSEK